MSNWTKDDFNKAQIIGRAGKDFGVKVIPNGMIASGSIATGGGKKKDGGSWPTEWFDLKAFGEVAEALAETKKGDTVWVKVGRLTQEQWDDKETGKPRSKVVVKVEEFEIVKPKDDF